MNAPARIETGIVDIRGKVWRPTWGRREYEVSSDGDVRSLDRTIVDRNGREMRLRGRDLKPKLNKSSGYLYVFLGRGHRRHVHELVLSSFVQDRPHKHTASHINGDKTDNRVCNLAWETHQVNCARKKLHGTELIGERANTAKLTADKVAEMRSSFSGVRGDYMKLARIFSVSESTVRSIIKKETWRHV